MNRITRFNGMHNDSVLRGGDRTLSVPSQIPPPPINNRKIQVRQAISAVSPQRENMFPQGCRPQQQQENISLIIDFNMYSDEELGVGGYESLE